MERATARRALPQDWCPGIDAQAEPTAPALDMRTAFTIQNQHAGSGTSAWLETIVRVSSNLRFRHSPTVPIPFARAHPRSMSVSASLVPPRTSPRRVRLAPSERSLENRKRHLRPGRCQLLIVQRQAMNLPIDVQNTRCMSTTLASISPNAVQGPTTAVLVCRGQPSRGRWTPSMNAVDERGSC